MKFSTTLVIISTIIATSAAPAPSFVANPAISLEARAEEVNLVARRLFDLPEDSIWVDGIEYVEKKNFVERLVKVGLVAGGTIALAGVAPIAGVGLGAAVAAAPWTVAAGTAAVVTGIAAKK
jgi:hypothetical protein